MPRNVDGCDPRSCGSCGYGCREGAKRSTVKTWLAEVLPKFFSVNGHMLGLPAIRIDGDRASGRTFCFNPMVLEAEKPSIMQVGLWYVDEFVRTPEGWRMSRRVEEKCFDKVF